MSLQGKLKEDVESDINSALSMSGLLFQPHPDVGSWEATRPGMQRGEVLAFKNDNAGVRRLYLRHFREGESFEPGKPHAGDGVFEEDTWIVDIMDKEDEYPWEERFHGSLNEAVEDMATLMTEISQEREPRKFKRDLEEFEKRKKQKSVEEVS